MTGERVETHPVRAASYRQMWWTIVGALTPGAVVLFTALQADQPIGRTVIGGAALAVLLPLAAAEKARRGTVREAEDETTPVADPRDDQGRPLRNQDADALQQLLDDRLRDLGYLPERTSAAQRPTRRPAGPTGTTAVPDLSAAQSMRATSAADQSPHWDPDRPDFYAGQALAVDEQRAARQLRRRP